MSRQSKAFIQALQDERRKRQKFEADARWFERLNHAIAQAQTEDLTSLDWFVATLPTVGHHLLPDCTERQRSLDVNLLMFLVQQELDRRGCKVFHYSQGEAYLAVGLNKNL